MEQRIIPTSPKSTMQRDVHHSSPRVRLRFLGVVVGMIAMSLFAGGIGVLLTVLSVGYGWLGKLLPVPPTSTLSSVPFLVTPRTATDALVNRAPDALQNIIPLYRNGALPTLEKPGIFLGNAVVISSDGWMAADPAIVEEGASIILPDGQIKTIDDQRDDPITHLTFFHVAARDLSAVRFPAPERLTVGQAYSLVQKQPGSLTIIERRVVSNGEGEFWTESTDDPHPKPKLDGGTDTVMQPLFANTGEFMGFVQADGFVIQSTYIAGVLPFLATGATLEQPQVIIETLNLGRLPANEKDKHDFPGSGFVVRSMRTRDGVSTDHWETLRVGDVLTSLNGNVMDARTDVRLLMRAYPAGSDVTATIVRDGTQQVITFPLP